MKTQTEVRPELIEKARELFGQIVLRNGSAGVTIDQGATCENFVRVLAAFAQFREGQGHDLTFWKESALALTTLLKMRCTPKEWDEINAMLDLPVPPSPTQGDRFSQRS